jgi:preprotein translocase subunit Sec61beta
MPDKISMPSGFGGLLRYDQEYKSKFKLKPEHVIVFVVAIVVFYLVLKIFFPIAA